MRRQTAKLFMNGRSQAVRLPAGFRFEGSEVFISRAGEKVILSPKPTSWDAFFEATERPTPDFMAERVDELPQARELL
jgi:antitoxin VapB